jgi:phosphoribosyl 1,2-cyclic phosphodiesterase
MFRVLFLGTGVSTAIPNLSHVLFKRSCPVCSDAQLPGSRNRRNNVSIAVIFADSTGSEKCIIVDVGKTMRDSMMNLLPQHGISEIDALIITHGHADAMLGLDDARDLQQFERIEVPDADYNYQLVSGFKYTCGPLPVYLTAETMKTVNDAFGYLTRAPEFLDEAAQILRRRIAYLSFHTIEPDCSFSIHDFLIKAFPVWHGGEYVSLGFSFGLEGEFVYISDVKIVPPTTLAYLKAIPKIKNLVIDTLDRDGIWSHMGLEESMQLITVLQPEKAFLTGMSCELGLHDDVQKELSSRCANVFLAYDGLVLHDLVAR